MNKEYVTTGKPKVGGAVFHAPAGSTLPTDATTALDAAFADMGYCSEDGLKQNEERTTEDIKEWGGTVVDSSQTEKKDEYTMTLIESMNVEVLKVVHGSDNVTGTLAAGITVTGNDSELDYEAYVVDMILKNAVKRIVLPYAKVTKVAEVEYKSGQAVGYQVTLAAYPDASGNTHYEYIKQAS